MSDSASTAATAAPKGKSLASSSPKAKSDTPPQLKSVALGPNTENGKSKPGTTKTKKKTSSEKHYPIANNNTSHTTSANTVVNVGHSCGTCKSVDNSRMVQCDDCDGWNHFSCVGVNQSVENKKWNCAQCQAKKKKKTGATKVARNTAAAKKVEKSKPEKTSDGKKNKTPSAMKEMEDSLPRKPMGTTKPTKAASVKSAGSRRSAKAHLELQLQKLEAEQKLLEEKRKLMEKHFSILEELVDLEDEEDADEEEVDADTKVQNWLGATGGRRQEEEECSDDEEEEEGGEMDSSDDSEEESVTDSSDDSSEDEKGGTNESSFNPKGRSTPAKKGESKRKDATSSRLTCNLTRNQLAARHVVAKDLPLFSGNPEEWPMFFSTFESTTRMCGYTDDENMIRLRNCLKGDAFAAVRSFLLHPKTVNRAMDALKLKFGQPRFIIESLKDKVLAIPPVDPESMNAMVDFALDVQNLTVTIDACGRKELKQDASLLNSLVSKLPGPMQLQWAKHSRSIRKVNLKTFGKWIYEIGEDACLVSKPRQTKASSHNQEPRRRTKAYVNAHVEHQGEYHAHLPGGSTSSAGARRAYPTACIVCRGSCASLANCQGFRELSYDGRWAITREAKMCRKCLKRHRGGCVSRNCGVNGCSCKHHPLLHKQLNPESAPMQPNSESTPIQTGDNAQREERSCNTHLSGSSAVLFRYVPVVVHGNGIVIQCYAFLDDGSSLTLMDQDLADELNLKGELRPLGLKWTGGTYRTEDNSQIVSLDVSGLKGKRYHLEDVRTVEELQLPSQTLDVTQLQRDNPYLRGIPVDSYTDVRPRLLIGVQHANATLVRKSREGESGQPIAVKTNLGWTIYGGAPTGESHSMVHYTYHVYACDNQTEDDADEKLDRAVKDFFSLESLGITAPTKTMRSADDERALKLLRELTKFDGERYTTGLLWRYNITHLPDSKPMALKRFLNLERRMAKDPELRGVLQQKLADYVTKGYVRKLTKEELEENHERVWYLPVFPVINPNKPGKIRLVWDAAATTHEVSLNSLLLTGPDLTTPLVSVLFKFREHRFGICGDIREMFHQVGIRGEDQHSQRFLWREERELGEPSVYVMQVMTFGACCSPSSAQYVKNMNAERFSEQFPAASAAIVQCTYVDDMLCSTETEEEAIELAKTVWDINNRGGFEIRNWMSNSVGILSALRGDSCAEKSLDLSSSLATEKVLGMWWCTKTDCFTYKINWDRLGRELLEGNRCPTKREVLRTLMTIYDPLGLIAHFLMFLKVLLQEIWRTRVGWDENIDDKCFEKWRKWLHLLPNVENVSIPRCYRMSSSIDHHTEIQLHTFVDASENGTAAAVYLRFVEGDNIECSLVTAKSRVAPLKYLSIPRLELQAAVIGARLAAFVMQGLSIKVARRVFWSDSRNVIAWIRADHRKYNAFVAARVSELLDLTSVSSWKWVPTKWNVADEGTKWQCQPSLTNDSRWFKAPEFLWQAEKEWPDTPEKLTEPVEELRACVNAHFQTESEIIPVKDFSTWRRLVNTTAYVFRYLRQLRPKKFTRTIEILSSEEIHQAEDYLLRTAQQDVFRTELNILRRDDRNATIPKQSQLYKLNPFIDEKGLLRMHGRTGACKFLAVEIANPIILPRDHPITNLIVESYHQKFHHQNHESVINEVRQKYCISCLRRVYAKVRSNCQRCKLREARPRPPAMADLPKCRLAAFVRPFTHTGIDYFGPMEVAIGRRVEKRWGVLLTCLTIRGAYLDLASSLTTSSCIMVIRNFIVRRGTPSVFYSDRGTNFIGADRELKQALQDVDQHKMAQEFVSATTTWCFNPPAAPHMGGSWERLVQSVKRTLVELQLPHRPKEEELRSALVEIEGIINARPLTHVPIEDDAAPALTPNHWLLGSSDGFKPWTELEVNSIALSRGWHLSQQIANHFWKRWLREYLPEITRRSKWHQNVPPIKEGDIVVIVDSELPRNCWPKGRVIGTVNRDGQVRTVTIKTAKGVYERPAVKVAVIDVRAKKEFADSEAESAN
ncbi:uncharacterized protein LOC129743023 [Uranotaenia lowii]|uniref:uncharacterized protein LOC129743023 n=1 Tax=Uranotaenia lowii TaxID=190385 RepID=UPI002479CECD|nr:uncharacterized protein LOC129743023 [Uranotaenia lowii]